MKRGTMRRDVHQDEGPLWLAVGWTVLVTNATIDPARPEFYARPLDSLWPDGVLRGDQAIRVAADDVWIDEDED